MIPFIDLKAQYKLIDEKIQNRINTVIDHGRFIMGPEIGEMEERLAEYVGTKHCISMSSGTDALLVALMAIGISPGDEVIIPDFSFFATAEVISILGATPIMVDINPKTYNLAPDHVENKITDKTKAIMPVALYGQCADMDQINEIALKNNIYVVEDGAQSFGATYKQKKSCSLSTIGCTSFFPSKPLACYGDGGACFTDDDDLAKVMKEIRTHGQQKRYHHVRIGLNCRMDTLQAAIILEKIKIFDEEMKKRQVIAKRYSEGLAKQYVTPFIEEYNISAYAQYTILVENRDELQAILKEAGIPTAVHYPIPISRQPYYEGKCNIDNPNALEMSKKVMSLPMSPYLDQRDQDFIIEQLLKKRA